MDKLRRIVLMAFIGVVLPCLSFAVPDFYIYNNYMTGISPYSTVSNIQLNDDGYWEEYNPIQNILGFVTSFSKEHMTGTNPPSAVPAYDLDLYMGHQLTIPSGQAVVLYSGSGEVDGNLINSSSIPALLLGTTSATNYTIHYYGDNTLYTGSERVSVPINYSSTDFNNIEDKRMLFNTLNQMPLTIDGSSPFTYSFVWLFFNNSNSSASVYVRGWSGSAVELSGIPITDISWDVVTSSSYSSADYSNNFIYFVPHMKAEFDLYSLPFRQDDSTTDYNFNIVYSRKLYFDWSNSIVNNNYTSFISVSSVVGSVGSNVVPGLKTTIPLSNIPVSSSLCPIFLHQYNATRYISGKAIYVYDGYININNYEELVALLKEQGVGQNDLTRVIELLDEINTGGNTGENVKELVGILEGYHEQLMQNGDFGSVTNIFDTYKNLLDFSSDMHWLITANNALFGYFAGFIMLCAMFLILNRIMR